MLVVAGSTSPPATGSTRFNTPGVFYGNLLILGYAWTYAGGANAWSGLSLDERRGLVYAATGSASYDFYGASRHGDNLYANSILCLGAATGERVWRRRRPGVTHHNADVWRLLSLWAWSA
jgi:glucose dehydrogenase